MIRVSRGEVEAPRRIQLRAGAGKCQEVCLGRINKQGRQGSRCYTGWEAGWETESWGALWNPLGNVKSHWCLDPALRSWFNGSEMWPGHLQVIPMYIQADKQSTCKARVVAGATTDSRSWKKALLKAVIAPRLPTTQPPDSQQGQTLCDANAPFPGYYRLKYFQTFYLVLQSTLGIQ